MPLSNHPLTPRDRDAMQVLRERIAANSTPPTRASFDQLVELTPPAPGVEYRDDVVGGVPGTWCLPQGAARGAALLYLHGGAFILGSARAFRHFVGQLATRAGVAAFVADYRLAPEHAFPAAFDDAHRAYLGLVADFGAARVTIAGDSAGGGLALSLLAAHRGAARAVLFSPWTDLTLTALALEARALEDPILTRRALEAGVQQYLRDVDPRDARASPLLGVHGALPPCQVHVGTAEILLDDSLRLEAAGADVHVWEGLPHVFPRSLALFDAAGEALELSGAFLRGGP